jgi:hypothetical protein
LNQSATTNRKLPLPPPRKTIDGNEVVTNSPTIPPKKKQITIVEKSDETVPETITSPLSVAQNQLSKTKTGTGKLPQKEELEKIDKSLKSPRIQDDSGFVQKTPPPRPVSRVLQKGDLNEVQDLLKNGEKRRLPLPPVRKVGTTGMPVSSPSILKVSEVDKKNEKTHRTPPVPMKSMLNIKDATKSGFVLFIPKIVDDDSSEDEEETKRKLKKQKYLPNEETIQIFDKKYEYPSKLQHSSATKIQKMFRKKTAKKILDKLSLTKFYI